MHTPGPWSHNYTVNPLPGYDISGPNSEPNAGICDVGDLPLEANARLIAAAPKLLEALKELTPSDWSLNSPMSLKYGKARAVIAEVEE